MTDEQVIDDVLRRETATYTNRAADRGGPTKYGITLDTLSRWRQTSVTPGDVEALTEGEARRIYQARYVTPWAWLGDDRLRALCVDWAVTSWHDDPAKALQREVGATVDGSIGPQTVRLVLQALERGDADRLYRAVLSARIRYYTDLALNDPPLRTLLTVNPKLQVRNLRGWLNRCAEFV